MLPALLWLSTHDTWIHDYPAMAIAFFHTTLALFGVLLMRPLIGRLGHWLEGKFVSLAEEIGRPQYLDANVIVSPALAMDAFGLELQRMAELTRRHAIDAFRTEGLPGKLLQQQHDGLRQLARHVETSVTKLETDRLSSEIAKQLPLILRIANYIDEAVALAHDNAASDADVELLLKTVVREDILAYQAAVIQLVEESDNRRGEFSAEALEQSYQALRARFRALKTTLLETSVAGRIPVRAINPAIESLRMMLRVAERSTRIAVRLSELASEQPPAAPGGPEQDEDQADNKAGITPTMPTE